MDIASNLFIAAFLILVAASAAVVGSMILLGLIDRIFRKKPPEPVVAVPEEEEVLEEWTEDFWSKDAAHADRSEAGSIIDLDEVEAVGGGNRSAAGPVFARQGQLPSLPHSTSLRRRA